MLEREIFDFYILKNMNKERVLIFGAGQIGSFYNDFFRENDIESQVVKTDITNQVDLLKVVKDYKPTVVINTAAKTNLEWCDKNREEAFIVNVLGADNLAKICDKEKIYFIHISSGCIFESDNENDQKKENDIPNPKAYYALTKVWSEQLITFGKSSDFKCLILRPRQPISAQVNHRNQLVKFLTFVKFIDVYNTCTVLEDLMEWTKILIDKRVCGILHVANEGWITPYEVALNLKKYILPDLKIEKIDKEELNKLTPNRRVDTVLDVEKLKSLGVEVKTCKERLIEIVKDLKNNIDNCSRDILKKELEITVNQSKERTIVNSVWSSLIN